MRCRSVNDSDCQVVVTQDLSYRRGEVQELKQIVDEALEKCRECRKVVVYQRRIRPMTASRS